MPLNLSKHDPGRAADPELGRRSPRILDSFEFETQVGNSLVVREPVGVVGAITPWNYPLHQITLKVAPALAAGCTVVLKPSEVAPLNAFILAEVIHDVGLPAGVFNLVTGVGPVVGEAIASHPDVDMVSFTGSTRAGKRVAELCAQRVARVALELGGKSANVILARRRPRQGRARRRVQGVPQLGPDLLGAHPHARAARQARRGRETRGGDRRGVHRRRPVRRRRPCSARSSRPRSATRVRDYIQKGIDEGAKLLAGGAEAPEGLDKGYYVQPTVFSERHQRHDDRAGGDLRPGAVDHPLRHRGRGDRDRQRHDLRPRRRRVVRRHRARQAGRAAAAHRPGRGQRRRVQHARSVRWLQAVRPRPRGAAPSVSRNSSRSRASSSRPCVFGRGFAAPVS